MVVLGYYKMLLTFLGLDPHGGFGNLAVRFVHWIALTTSFLSWSNFFIVNIRVDMLQALTAMPLIVAFASLIPMFSYPIIYRKKLYSLLDELQDIIIESEKIDLSLSPSHIPTNDLV